jgi:hypothetical protein
MGSLYQKPGSGSTEFKLTIASLVGVVLGVPAGAVVMTRWHFWAGAGLMAAFTLVAVAFGISYPLGRAKVKAAVEAHAPPPSRTV